MNKDDTMPDFRIELEIIGPDGQRHCLRRYLDESQVREMYPVPAPDKHYFNPDYDRRVQRADALAKCLACDIAHAILKACALDASMRAIAARGAISPAIGAKET
jgi:hypothetical protein